VPNPLRPLGAPIPLSVELADDIKLLAPAVMPFRPLPMSPLNLLTVASKLAFEKESPIPGRAALASLVACAILAEADEISWAKGLMDSAILVKYLRYTLFISLKMCYYIINRRSLSND
jgi:hypothetical protein